MATRTRTEANHADFASALRPALERVRQVASADVVALYPYDEETDAFYVPLAIGLPSGDAVQALPDLNDQLRRFREDEAQGKIPGDISPANYGPSAWLLATGRPLVSADARQEVDSSFVRRHKVQGMIGLPLRVGAHLVGLLYLDYLEAGGKRKPVDVADPALLARVEEAAGEVALALDEARHHGEIATLRAIADLVGNFSYVPSTSEEGAIVQQVEDVLTRLRDATGLKAAALYAPYGPRYHLVASQGWPEAEARANALPLGSPQDLAQDETLTEALAADDLHLAELRGPGGQTQGGLLVLADPDPLAIQRRLPVEATLRQTAADILGAMVNSERLLESLGETSRTLSAVTRLSNRLLKPGASEAETLQAAVDALTDPELPELNFEFADIFLLDTNPDGRLIVSGSAGATASPAIESAAPSGPDGRRVPAWAAAGTRLLHPRDVLTYVANQRRAVVVAPLDQSDGDHFITGYPEDELERLDVPLTRGDGSPAEYVHSARLRAASDRAPLRPAGENGGAYRVSDEFTLDAELFHAYGHAQLVRVFVPFGSAADGQRAMGVLEAGFHTSHRDRLDRVQIEALRASAATIAGAVETARLYESLRQRAQQLQIVTEVSRAIATSIDLEQTLSLVARNMARAVDASVCLIALLDEDGSAWYGAAASDMDEVWRQRRVERPERSIVFEVTDLGRPIVIEDAQDHELVSSYMARRLGIRSLVALPLQANESPIGAVILGQRDRSRLFTAEEVDRALALAGQAAMAIRNARLHAREEEEHHIQKDVVMVGFGQWGQKAYKHLVLLKNFFNFRIHVVERDSPGRREAIAESVEAVLANGDLFYWDSPEFPAYAALTRELEPSCYVITYIVTPAETHLPMLKTYYDLSNVVLIEKPLGAPPEQYREFLDRTDGSVQIVAADHYWFKIEVRLLELLLNEERNLRAFLDEIEDVEIEILEEQPPGGSGAQIGMIADLIPHAFAILSLLTPLDRLRLAPHHPLQIGRYQPTSSEHETYARLAGSFEHRGRQVRVTIDVGKGVANAKWIKLTGPRRMGGRRAFYKFDFLNGEAMDGTQGALRAAVRPIRQPGVPDNAHLSMLRHVIEKKHPAVGILSIREAMRANARIRELEKMATDLLEAGHWTPYTQGQRPSFEAEDVPQALEAREPATAGS